MRFNKRQWFLLLMDLFIFFEWSIHALLAQNVDRSAFIPPVIRNDRTEPVLFEALLSGTFTEVFFNYSGSDRSMFDDGTHGDRIAGDNIYTITFDPSEIISLLTEGDVFRPFVGYCDLYQGSTRVFHLNVFAEIWTPDIPLVPVISYDSTCQASPNLVNIVEEGITTVSPSDAQRWGNAFYTYFGDDYDFLNFIVMTGYRGNRYHFIINSQVHGIGQQIYNSSYLYGSGGRLIGGTMFPLSYFFDGASTSYQHELGHQWINWLRGTPYECGVPHWPVSDLASGVMGYSAVSGQGLKFPYDLIPEGDNYRLSYRSGEPLFNDMELYLMGLLPPDSVQSHFVFDDQDQSITSGGLLSGPVTTVTIHDVIDSVGARDPDYSSSPKSFTIGTIVISETLLSVEAMSFYNYFAERAELHDPVTYKMGFGTGTTLPFYLSTGGRGELDTHIEGFPVAVKSTPEKLPVPFKLYQNTPNPFNLETFITFDVEKTERIQLKIFNLFGQEVDMLVDQTYNPGHHQVHFDARGLSSGIYFYRIQMGDFYNLKKMIFLK